MCSTRKKGVSIGSIAILLIVASILALLPESTCSVYAHTVQLQVTSTHIPIKNLSPTIKSIHSTTPTATQIPNAEKTKRVQPTSVPPTMRATNVNPTVSPTVVVKPSPGNEVKKIPTKTVKQTQKSNGALTLTVLSQSAIPQVQIHSAVQNIDVIIVVQIRNTESVDQGWNLIIVGNGLTNSYGKALPTVITTVEQTCIATCTPAFSAVRYPITVDGKKHTIYDAASKSGKGTINVKIHLLFSVSPVNLAGFYTSSLSINLV